MTEYDRAVARRVKTDLLVALQYRGRMSVTELLSLAPDDTQTDGYDIVLNAIDELSTAGQIRKVILPTETASLGYEFVGQGTPSEQRRRALTFLTSEEPNG